MILVRSLIWHWQADVSTELQENSTNNTVQNFQDCVFIAKLSLSLSSSGAELVLSVTMAPTCQLNLNQPGPKLLPYLFSRCHTWIVYFLYFTHLETFKPNTSLANCYQFTLYIQIVTNSLFTFKYICPGNIYPGNICPDDICSWDICPTTITIDCQILYQNFKFRHVKIYSKFK